MGFPRWYQYFAILAQSHWSNCTLLPIQFFKKGALFKVPYHNRLIPTTRKNPFSIWTYDQLSYFLAVTCKRHKFCSYFTIPYFYMLVLTSWYYKSIIRMYNYLIHLSNMANCIGILSNCIKIPDLYCFILTARYYLSFIQT